MAKVIKRKGTKRQKTIVYYNELIPVEGIGQIRVKIDNEMGGRFQTHLDSLLLHRGIPQVSADSYQRDLSPSDKIVDFFYRIYTELEEKPHHEALIEAKTNAFRYYRDAESAATVSAMMISLIDDNFEVKADGIRLTVQLKPPLNQVEVDGKLFDDSDENDRRQNSLIPPRTPRKKYVPEEQMIAILTALTEIDENFGKALSDKMLEAFRMVEKGTLTTSPVEVDEAGFHDGDMDADLSPTNEPVGVEV